MKTALILAVTLMLLPAVIRAEGVADRCERQARDVSGYQGGRIPPVRIGAFTARLSGSVAIGVTRSRGGSTTSVGPVGAGSGAREMREQRQSDAYNRALRACQQGR